MSTPDPTPADRPTFSPDGEYDDWDEAPITPRARTPWVTKLLTLAVVAGLAFVGGAYAHKHWGTSSSSPSTGSASASALAAARRSGGFGGFGGGGGGATNGGARAASGLGTSGQVSYIKGSTLYVADLTGGTVKVSTTGARVSKTSTIAATLIHPGDTVVVVGTKQANGTIAATSITVGGGVSALLGGS
jgi:hypothetical protein